MVRLIARRLAALIPLLLVVSVGVFMLIALVPGDPAVTLAGGTGASPTAIASIRAQLHLSDPLVVQYLHWLEAALHLNFGKSFATGNSVTHDVLVRLPATLSLVCAAAVVAVIVGVPLGVLAGLRPGGLIDRLARLAATAGVSIPGFWLALLLISLFAVRLHWLPVSGYTPITVSFGEWCRSIVLPAASLGLGAAATIARQLRRSLIDVMSSNYVRTAWAKGAGPVRVVGVHALKNAAIPAVTVFGLYVGSLLGGTVVVEQIFSVPGVGNYMLQGIVNHDLPAVQGVTLVFVMFQLGIGLLVDISYGYLNPRVRVS